MRLIGCTTKFQFQIFIENSRIAATCFVELMQVKLDKCLQERPET